MKRFFAKGFIVLLALMLFFTVLSRAADSFLVARVYAETYSAKKIEHIVDTEAFVQKNLEFPVMAEAGLLVKTVYVQEGSSVKPGDVLAEFDMEQLQEQIGLLRDEIRVLRLQNEALSENQAAAQSEQKKQKRRANEDYAKAVLKKEESVRRAAEELQQAEDAINNFSAGSMSQEEIDAKQAELWQTYFAKKQAYEDAESSGAENVEAAERALEDAEAKEITDKSAEINAISIARKQKELEAYEKLEICGGKIIADNEGTITGVGVFTGQKTGDTAAFTMASAEGGLRLSAVLPEADARYVEKGDAVTVEKNGTKYEDFTVTGITQNEDGSTELLITSTEYADVFSIGERVKVSMIKQSQLYSVAVPLTAIRTEQNKNFVYVLDEKQTVLGKEYFIRKVEVTVMEKNSSYAALQEGTLGKENLIVTDSNQYVQAGDRVRLQET